jgi:DMSO reductase anchor subunit
MKTYPSLAETIHREWGLVLFTTLVPAAVGVVMVGVVSGSPPGIGILAVGITILGLLASIGHLARPIRAPFAIRHWNSSWLSREILLSVAFFLFCIAWAASGWMDSGLTFYIGISSLIVAVTLFFVMGRSYQIWTRPAWDGSEIFGEFIAISLIVGIPAGELVLTLSKVTNHLDWLGAGGLALGLGLNWWVMRHRLHRLKGLPPDRPNAWESLAQRQKLGPYFQIILSLGVASLAATIVAVTISLGIIGWSVALFSGLFSQLLSRSLFYTLPVQRRYVVSLRPHLL